MNLNDQLQEFICSLGASDVGFANLAHHSHPTKFPKAVSFCVKLADAIIDEITTEPTHTYYAHYKAVNELINQITLRTALKIESYGYQAFPVPASQSISEQSDYRGIFPHKTASTLAGLGTIGKNGLLLHRKYGPAVRLGTVLTDAPLTCAVPIETSICEGCDRCVKACPAGAIHNKEWSPDIPRESIYDPRMCSDFMSAHFSKIGRGFVCGICISICPKRKMHSK